MQPATARPFVRSAPPATPPGPRLTDPPGAPLTPHHLPTVHSGHAAVMIAYLRHQGENDLIDGLFRLLNETQGSPEVRRDPFAPCWRFANGTWVYFGPVPYHPLSDHQAQGPLQLGPGSIWLPSDNPIAAWGQPEVAAAWDGWGEEERTIYTDVRAAGLAVVEQWFREAGHDPELAKSLEVRAMAARYASNAVERFRQWRREVLK